MDKHDTKIIRKEIIDLTCEFLETWIHEILYQWILYPREIFEMKKKFQVTVQVATHPDVIKYISSFVQSCHDLLKKGELKNAALLIIEDDDIPIEKFVFEALPSFRKDDRITLDMILDSISVYTLADLEQQFRASLLQLQSYESAHIPTELKENRTFRLSIEKLSSGYPEENDMQWIPSELQYNWRKMTPLKSQHMDIFRFNTFVMEASRKGKEKSIYL